METNINKFADQLLLERSSLGLNQQQIADAISISQQAIARWETGASYPRLAVLNRLCDFIENKYLENGNESRLRNASSQIPNLYLTQNSLSHWMRHARKRKNLRQQDVAEKLGILRSTIAHWETGRTKPSKETLIEFENLVEQTYDGDIENNNSSFKTLNNADIDAILICSRLQKTSTYDLILLVQSFIKEKNA
jgi:transcriptional regulator with XRE-family HTH domain